ncbi:uncharacterized protein BDZ99DRAFT_569055 [Mytilinidion resinicola]|uniref:DUF2231 domain-containing protein n=1 Tax=Mytilinidion resinicola TaxID=574789 RepID=A0A6A6YTT7_9PEZI|nr:uncharacterized protein BDZ99DRAFT_569055 [Mytilinidion resinicola]KAF2812366.1 hypothetical protein BDZ99DRAFT_569055 [Mytilinidion resinicola]
MGHPAHPATVHFPITFTVLSGLLDLFYAAATNSTTGPLILSALKKADVNIYLATIPILSYYTNILAIITAIPSIVTGIAQLMPLIKRNGVKTSKALTGIAHAALNDLVVFGNVYNAWTRRTATDYRPEPLNTVISGAVALPMVCLSAYLGANLVYKYGMGVGGPTGDSKLKKVQ